MDLRKMTAAELREKKIDFERVLTLTGYAPRTIHYYLCDIDRFLTFLEKRNLDLLPETLERYEARLYGCLKTNSANRAVIAINRFLRHAGQGSFKMRTRKPESSPQPVGGMSQSEFTSLVRGCLYIGKSRMALILLTMAETGVSADTLSLFTLEAVESGTVKIGEGFRQKRLILPEPMRTCLLAYVAREKRSSGSLFVNRSGGPLSRSYISAELKNIARELNLDPDHVRLLQLRTCTPGALWDECRQAISAALA